jgi:hypothetical protein
MLVELRPLALHDLSGIELGIAAFAKARIARQS